MTRERLGTQRINQNIKKYNVKILKYNKKNSLKTLGDFLNKRKSLQKKTSIVIKIIKMLKKR